ncbi:MAG: hypothetical protein DMG70_26440 [Acidobacteria bacterium]|nr:MAG: hypothetical protein DMG70_26440 [Acidobacteriota bacterium]PYY08375.1 MAG: hypothetical protein DMG69_15395 [Acidobacteriota bacterium]
MEFGIRSSGEPLLAQVDSLQVIEFKTKDFASLGWTLDCMSYRRIPLFTLRKAPVVWAGPVPFPFREP